MSWEQRPGDGACGAPAVNDAADAHPASGPHQENGDPHGSPHVYHPYADVAPEYDLYADPAAAHGWQNAYDETQRLPPVSYDGDRASVAYDTYDGGPDPEAYGDGGDGYGPDPGPRAGSRHRARSAPRFRLPRPAVVAAGALGAVGIAVALAGAFSGSSGAPGGEPARPNVKPSLPLPEGPASSATEPSAGATGSPSAGASSSASGAAGGDPAGSPAPTASAPASPSAAASATGTAGVVRKPGRGHGATKGPR